MLCHGGVSFCVMSRTSKAQHRRCFPGGLKLRAPGHAWGRQTISILLIAIYREEEQLVCISLDGNYGALDLHCTVPWETLASSGAARGGSGASDGTRASQTHPLRGLLAGGIFLSSPKPGNTSMTATPGRRETDVRAGLCSDFGGASRLFGSFTDPRAALGLNSAGTVIHGAPNFCLKTEPMGHVKPPLKAASALASSGRPSRHCCASSPEKWEPTVYVVDWLFHMKDKLSPLIWSHSVTSSDNNSWLPAMLYLYCLCHPKAFQIHASMV